MVLQQFSATAKEISQIRIGGPGYAVIDTVRQCHPGIEIERHVIPLRILEHRISEVRSRESLSDVRWVRILRPTSELQPTSLPGTIPGKICSLLRGFTVGP